MRGKVGFCSGDALSERITPAYAGKSDALPLPRLPRYGSPPRMRGKVNPGYGGRSPRRITPAYAGKSGGLLGGLPCLWDHPRVCGEKKK